MSGPRGLGGDVMVLESTIRAVGAVRWRMLASCIVCLWLFSPVLSAATVKLQVKPGILATADYWENEGDRPPVLILHGFLQTARFPTVRRLAEGLADSDYTVLTPTLSLGVTERRKSQPCEALHLQTLEDDVAELAQWVQWLYRKHGRRVVLMGHSAGGHVITRYLSEHPDAPVQRVILISLSFPVGKVLQKEPARADGIGEYALGFCQHFPATVAAYHSYVGWGPEQMLETIQAHSQQLSVIIGSGDRRIKQSWVDTLHHSGIELKVIEGANHFFDSAHGFDLQDAVEELLGSTD